MSCCLGVKWRERLELAQCVPGEAVTDAVVTSVMFGLVSVDGTNGSVTVVNSLFDGLLYNSQGRKQIL